MSRSRAVVRKLAVAISILCVPLAAAPRPRRAKAEAPQRAVDAARPDRRVKDSAPAGLPSVAFVNSGLFHPYQSTATGSWPEAVAIGDVNGDGRKDVLMTTSSYFDAANDYKLFVFLQNADGTLAPAVKYPAQGNQPTSVAVGDVNGDGRYDVVIGNSGSAVGVFLQNVSGGLEPVALHPSTNSLRVRIADLNNDGRQDVVGLGWGTNSVSVWLQQPNGSLALPVTYPAQHAGYDDLEVGDLNNDGRTDVVVMSGQLFATPNMSILHQQADGTLGAAVPYALGGNRLTHGVAVGDFNGDGRADAALSFGGNSPSAGLAVYYQNAAGGLNGPVFLTSYDIPEPAAGGDVNGDGRLDIVVAHGGWVALGVYLQGESPISSEELYSIPYASHYNPHGLAVGDVTGDGANDVVLADYNNGLVVLRNRGAVLTIANASTGEGNSGSTNAVFSVTLSRPLAQTVTVGYATANGSATAGSDYTAVSGVLEFGPSETTKTISVPVAGDLLVEGDETFSVNLSNALGAPIDDAEAVGTIVSDDFAPPSATTGAATGIGFTGATLTGAVNPNGAATTAYFLWQGQPFGTGVPNATPVVGLGSETGAVSVNATLTGLACSTTTYFRVVAVNSAGTSLGAPASFQTRPCDPIAPETTILTGPPQDPGGAAPAANNAGLVAPAVGAQPGSPGTPPGGFRSDRILVKRRATARGAAVAGLHASMGGEVAKRFARLPDVEVVRLPAGKSVDEALAEYRASGLVEYAEPDHRRSAVDAQPNDPSFASQWGLHNTGQGGGLADADIDAPEAWAIRTDASSVIVAVIDTGVRYTHQDLSANVWTNPGEIPGNLTDDDGNGYVDDVHGINTITGSGNPMDDHGHGTHVAGTIGATGNNGIGVSGVAWQARILGCKFIGSDGYGYDSDAIECIDYALSKGAKVLSNSWGSGDFSLALLDAVVSARNAGAIFVAAAGNSASNNDVTPFYPASYGLDNVVSVASTTRYDQMSYFSSYGATTVDLAAPGSEILSTWGGSDSDYVSISGTSMATPHVSGALALVWAQYAGEGYLGVIQRLYAATDPLPVLAGKCVTGGRLNLARALAGVSLPVGMFTWTGSDNLTPAGSLAYAYRLSPIEPGFSAFTNATAASYFNLGPGTYTFFVKARDEAGNVDPTPASWTFTIAAPKLSIGDVSVGEGDAGDTSASFTVSLASPSAQPVSVSYATANGTATAPGDYAAAAGTLTFAPGETAKTIDVAVHGDALNEEPARTFFVNLSNPTGGAIVLDGQGVGTILDDDPLPMLGITGAIVTEGNSGSIPAAFSVQLGAPSGRPVSFTYATVNGNATAGADYTAKTGTLTIPAGATAATVQVSVLGDTLDEPNEAFLLVLSSPLNAAIGQGSAQATILDDDGRPALCKPIATVPAAITVSDNYCLVGNLSSSDPLQPALTIQADDVQVDFKGFTLDGPGVGSETAADGVYALNQRNITLRDGAVRGFRTGIFIDGDSESSSGHVVRRMAAIESRQAGIWVVGVRTLVRDSRVLDAGGTPGPSADAYGIVVEGALSRVIANDVINVSATGAGQASSVLLMSASRSIVEKNRIGNAALGSSASSGIVFDGGSNLFALSNSLSNLDNGIVFTGGATGAYRGNLTSGVPTPFTGGTDLGKNQ